jgi:hypothetical protein
MLLGLCTWLPPGGRDFALDAVNTYCVPLEDTDPETVYEKVRDQLIDLVQYFYNNFFQLSEYQGILLILLL